jgi:hypothetical protein
VWMTETKKNIRKPGIPEICASWLIGGISASSLPAQPRLL